ncbi:hypothetical protein Tco_0990946 [Tanacetum coccineum]|uniref:Uncharacterized protein n=1 Tax=Tanacetum coccineum TaxID=301880 RepID=A0ABQ5EY96_9ASTR
MKPILNKLNWKNEDLTIKVEKLRVKLKEIQALAEKSPYDKDIKAKSIKALEEYNVASLKEGEAGIESTLSVLKMLLVSNDSFSNTLSPEEATDMIREVTDKEIKNALFDIGDNKAPGPDSYSSIFFKKAWGIIGKDVCDAVKEFFLLGKY